jgi:pyrroline-5-carboxylate reductase
VIAFVGAGKMGEALLAGLIRSGRPVADVRIVERYPQRVAELRERYGVEAIEAAAAATADTLVLAVKPQDMATLLAELAPAVTSDQLLVSIAAGITTSFIERRVGEGVPVVRAMPNTPALVGEAMTAIAPGSHAVEAHLTLAEGLFAPVGDVVRVTESQLDAVTAVSGSGPAYVFLLAEAMTDAGVLLGLSRDVALRLAVQTIVGSGVMLRDAGPDPVALRAAVTSPAGTTAAAIRELERHGVRAAVQSALEAARDRSRELAGD